LDGAGSDLGSTPARTDQPKHEMFEAAMKRLATASYKTFHYLQMGKLKTFTGPVIGGKFDGPYDVEVWNFQSWFVRFMAGQ
jgi:hypothetical protein